MQTLVRVGTVRYKEWDHTPSLPRPGRSPSSFTVRLSSFCKHCCRCLSSSVSTGRARIHFCMTVQMFGVGLPGVVALRVSNEGAVFKYESSRDVPVCPFCTVVVGPSETIGKTACHCPNLLATPLQTVSFVKSSGLHTCPCINLYMRPLWNLARSGGARLCCESKECEVASPVVVLASAGSSQRSESDLSLTFSIYENFCPLPVRS